MEGTNCDRRAPPRDGRLKHSTVHLGPPGLVKYWCMSIVLWSHKETDKKLKIKTKISNLIFSPYSENTLRLIPNKTQA